MKRQQHAHQKRLVLLLQRCGKTVDNTAEHLQQFGHTVVAFRLVDECVEDIVYLFANVGTQVQKLAVDSMKRCFEKVALPRIFAIEQFQQLKFFLY